MVCVCGRMRSRSLSGFLRSKLLNVVKGEKKRTGWHGAGAALAAAVAGGPLRRLTTRLLLLLLLLRLLSLVSLQLLLPMERDYITCLLFFFFMYPSRVSLLSQ